MIGRINPSHGNLHSLISGKMQRFMPGRGEYPFPLRGMERFMHKKGIHFPGAFPGAGPQGITPPEGGGSFNNTMDV